MTNKKLLQIVVILAAGAALFTSILLIGMQKIQKQRAEATTAAPAFSTTAPTTAAPSTTLPSVTIDGNRFGDEGNPTVPTAGTTAPPTTAPTTAAFQMSTDKNSIIRTYVNAVNALKATPAFNLKKTETLEVVIDEMTPSALRSLANRIIEGNTKDEPEDYSFSGGSDAASGKSANFVIAPAGKSASLDPSFVTSAVTAPTADGGCTLTLTLGSDVQTLTSLPAKLSTCMDVLSVESVGLPSAAKLDEMTVNYDNAVITATLDRDGRIIRMEHRLIVTEATTSGSYLMSASARMHGNSVMSYEVAYPSA